MKEKYKIQIGDTLYENNESYKRTFAWEVLDIWFEDYISGTTVIVKCSNGTWTEEFFASQILAMYRSKEEAEQALKGGAE